MFDSLPLKSLFYELEPEPDPTSGSTTLVYGRLPSSEESYTSLFNGIGLFSYPLTTLTTIL